METSAPWTIGRLLTWTTDYLKQHGAESPRLDAEVLLAHCRNCKRIELYTAFDQEPTEAARNKFRALVRERAAGKPVAYLVGQREFYSLPFEVTMDVLIPRPETELLVVRSLDLAKTLSTAGAGAAPLEIADVGTGSGILAVTLARHLKNARVLALDISPAALEVTRRNVARHAVADRVELLESDLFAAVGAERRFQIIVSNPPYVREEEFAKLPTSVRDFEPRGALVAGKRGTEVIELLATQAADRLQSGGWLLVEISPMIEADARAIFGDNVWELSPTIKDQAGLARVLVARRK